MKIGDRVKVVGRAKAVIEVTGEKGTVTNIGDDYPPDTKGQHYWVKLDTRGRRWFYEKELKII